MRVRTVAVGLVAVLALGACSGDDSGEDGDEAAPDTTEAEATTTTAAPEPLRILVSNDDGVGAPGIDALVEGLQTLDDVEITVSAPAENQSGTSDSRTPGDDPEQETTTASGYPATAVRGYPADAVEQGLAAMGIDEPPHLVISGINEGQNIGSLTELSGTVGAARTGARAGIPALAVSQGFFLDQGPEPDYPTAVELTLDWVTEHREELLAADRPPGTAEVTNLNVPTCDGGQVRGVVEVPVATEAQTANVDYFAVDCNSDLQDPTQDVEAFGAGFAPLSRLTA